MKDVTSKEWPGTAQASQAEARRRRKVLHAIGFRPAFFDCATFTLHPSRHAHTHPAADHVPGGLPDEGAGASSCGNMTGAKPPVVAGFERNGLFFTLTSAWRAAQEWGCVV